LKQESVTKHNM